MNLWKRINQKGRRAKQSKGKAKQNIFFIFLRYEDATQCSAQQAKKKNNQPEELGD